MSISTESCIDSTGKALAPEADEVGVNSGKVLVAGSDGAPTSPPMAGNGSNCQDGLAPTAAAAADLVVIVGVSRNPSKLWHCCELALHGFGGVSESAGKDRALATLALGGVPGNASYSGNGLVLDGMPDKRGNGK